MNGAEKQTERNERLKKVNDLFFKKKELSSSNVNTLISEMIGAGAKYTKSCERVKVLGKGIRMVYTGVRGGKYVKYNGDMVRLRNLAYTRMN